jgi:hypothetical protein
MWAQVVREEALEASAAKVTARQAGDWTHDQLTTAEGRVARYDMRKAEKYTWHRSLDGCSHTDEQRGDRSAGERTVITVEPAAR